MNFLYSDKQAVPWLLWRTCLKLQNSAINSKSVSNSFLSFDACIGGISHCSKGYMVSQTENTSLFVWLFKEFCSIKNVGMKAVKHIAYGFLILSRFKSQVNHFFSHFVLFGQVSSNHDFSVSFIILSLCLPMD